MVVSERFVWAHIPKTGGDATATMIQQVPRLVVTAHHLADHAKHMPLRECSDVAGKVLVANTRRLPEWAVSYMRHRARFGLPPDYEPEGLRPPEVVATEPAADGWLDEIVGDSRIDFWIRQECLADDLVNFLRAHAGLTSEEEAAIRAVGRVNEQPGRFRVRQRLRRRFQKAFFTPEQTELLYASNPRWAAVERRVYG
jgi:hypothetical protein